MEPLTAVLLVFTGILIFVLCALLLWEGRQAAAFISERDELIEAIVDIQRVVNMNAEVQAKAIERLNSNAQDIDIIEKVLAIHAQTLKLYGPVLVHLKYEDLPELAKTKNLGE